MKLDKYSLEWKKFLLSLDQKQLDKIYEVMTEEQRSRKGSDRKVESRRSSRMSAEFEMLDEEELEKLARVADRALASEDSEPTDVMHVEIGTISTLCLEGKLLRMFGAFFRSLTKEQFDRIYSIMTTEEQKTFFGLLKGEMEKASGV